MSVQLALARMFPKTLQTERLQLRPPCVADAQPIFDRYAQDTDVTRFLLWAPHKSVSQTRCFLEETERFWRDASKFPWTILNKEDNSILGMIELRPESKSNVGSGSNTDSETDSETDTDQRHAEVGYVLARDVWGQGYMTEALRAVLDMGLSEGKLNRIWATCDVANTASARVLEKSGMTVEKQLRRHAVHPNLDSEPRDCFIYAIVR